MITSTIKKLLLSYYLVFVLLILTSILGYFLSLKFSIDKASDMGIGLQSFSILILLLFIPTALRTFALKINKLKDIEDLEEKLNKYIFWSNVRLAMITFPLLANVLLYYLIQNNSMLFCAAISAVALLFCKPQHNKLLNELNITE